MRPSSIPHFTDYRDSNNTNRDGAQAGVDAHIAPRLFAELETRLSRLNHPRGWATKRDFRGGLHRAFMDVSGVIPRKIYFPPPLLPGYQLISGLPTAVLAMQHGVLKDEGGAHVEVVAPATSYYAAPGSEWCDGTEDHIYGLGLISAECAAAYTYALTWPYDVVDIVDNKHSLVGLSVGGMVEAINTWATTFNYGPSLHTGFMRLVAQCKQYFKWIDWLVPTGLGFSVYDPKWYGVHKIHTVGEQLDYWLVYMGPTGVRVAKLTPAYWYPNASDDDRVNLLGSVINIVQNQEVVTPTGTVALSEEESLWYESLLLQNLEFVTGDPTYDLIPAEDPGPFDGGWPVYHGVKFNGDCSKAKVVVTGEAAGSTQGDYYHTNTQWLCELTIASPGPGEDPRPTSAAWSTLEAGSWSDGTPLTWLNVPRGLGTTGQYLWGGNVHESRGNGTPIYQVHFDEEPVRFYAPSATHPYGGVTAWLDMYAPWLLGGDNKSVSFLGSLPGNYSRYGYTIGPLDIAEGFDIGSLTTVDISVSTTTGGAAYSKQNSFGSGNLHTWDSPDALDGDIPGNGSKLERYTTGSISLDDTQVTVNDKAQLTAVIILKMEAEAVITASYTEVASESTLRRAKAYGGKAMSVGADARSNAHDVGNDGRGGAACTIRPAWGPYNVYHEFLNWRGSSFDPPGYDMPVGKHGGGSADIGPEATPYDPYWCTATAGLSPWLLRSSSTGRITAGWWKPSFSGWDTYINTTVEDVHSAESHLITKYGTIELSSETGAWSGALIPYEFGDPFVIVSALGNSIIYQTAQNSSNPDYIDTAGSDIDGSFFIRHVGVI